MTEAITMLVIAALIAIGIVVLAFLKKGKGASPVAGKLDKQRSSESPAAASLIPNDALLIGSLENPLVTITPYVNQTSETSSFQVPAALKEALGPLVQKAPELFRLGREMASKSFRVVFSPEVTRSLNNGSLNLLKDASGNLLPAVQKNGRFFENGRVIVQGGIQMANVAAMGWQIASIATAQHYLAEINEKLEKIEHGLADVLFLLNEEKRSHLGAYIKLLRQYHEAIRRGQLHPSEADAIYKKFEDLEQECLAIAGIGREMSKRKLAELQDIKISDWFSRSGSADRAKELVSANEKAVELVFLAHSCRVLACQVKAALPGDRRLLLERLNLARREVQETKRSFHEAQDQFFQKIEGLKKRENNPIALWGIFDTDHNQGVSQSYQAAELRVTEVCQLLDEQATKAASFSNQFDQMVDSGIAITLNLSPSGEMELLSAGPA